MGRTNEPHFVGILTARQINQMSGGGVIAPWEISLLPDEWQYAFQVMAHDVPEIKKNIDAIESTRAKWRSQFTH